MKKLYFCTNQDRMKDKENGLDGAILVAASRTLLALGWQWYYKGEQMKLDEGDFTIKSAAIEQTPASKAYDINDPARDDIFYDEVFERFCTSSWMEQYGFSASDGRFTPTVVFNRSCLEEPAAGLNLYDVLATPHIKAVVPIAIDEANKAYAYEWSTDGHMLKVYVTLHGISRGSTLYHFQDGIAQIWVASKVRVKNSMFVKVQTSRSRLVGTPGNENEYARKLLQDTKERMSTKHPEWKENVIATARFIHSPVRSSYLSSRIPLGISIPGVLEVTAYKSIEDLRMGTTDSSNHRHVWLNAIGNVLERANRGSTIVDGDSEMSRWMSWAVEHFIRNGAVIGEYFTVDMTYRDRGELPIEREMFNEFSEENTESWLPYEIEPKDNWWLIPDVPSALDLTNRIAFTLCLPVEDTWFVRFTECIKTLMDAKAITFAHRQEGHGEILIKLLDFDAYVAALEDDTDKELCSFIITMYNREVLLGHDGFLDVKTAKRCFFNEEKHPSVSCALQKKLDAGFLFADTTVVTTC